MNKIVALTLTASIALASLTGCAAKDAQRKDTNVSGISNSVENDSRDGASRYQDPENIVFENDMSAIIDLPVDDIKVTFEGKELMPGRNIDGYGKYMNSVHIAYVPGELSYREGMARLQSNN